MGTEGIISSDRTAWLAPGLPWASSWVGAEVVFFFTFWGYRGCFCGRYLAVEFIHPYLSMERFLRIKLIRTCLSPLGFHTQSLVSRAKTQPGLGESSRFLVSILFAASRSESINWYYNPCIC